MNELKLLSNDLLISQTKSLVAREREITAQILHHLAEIQRRRLYCELGYSSLFVFCMRHLGYTESQTQRRIEAMRVLLEFPLVENKIKDGSLSLTAVAQAQSFFRSHEVIHDQKMEVLEKLEHKSTRECERELLKISSEKSQDKLLDEAPSKKVDDQTQVPREKIRQIGNDLVQITLTIPQELKDKLDQIKNLLSHKYPKMSQAELLDVMAKMVLDKLDPQRGKQPRKSQRAVSTAPKVSPTSTSPKSTFEKQSHQRYIPKIIKHMIWKKYEGQCSYVSLQGTKCQSQYQLEIDHIIPFSLGGLTVSENLRLLCKAHNQWAATQVLGKPLMNQYLKLP